MKQELIIQEILISAQAYLRGMQSGKQFVDRYDDLMADHLPDDLAQGLYEVLDNCHNELALYQEDEKIRASHRWVFGPGELKEHVQALVAKLQAIEA